MANNKNSKSKKNKVLKRFPFGWIFALIIFYLLISSMNTSLTGVPKEISYSEFYQVLKDNPGEIKSLTKIETELQGEFIDNTKFKLNIPENDQELLSLIRQNVAYFEVKPARTFWVVLLFNLGPILLLILFWWVMASRGEQLGNRIMSFGKMRPKMHTQKQDEKITFNDVAGVDEAKEELTEVIDFLKDPGRFQKLGGKIPKGVLLVGPPGTGKTLLAKAVSGEAGVPFFSISGSDFVEMFVGVGASRVRDLFEQGRRAAKTSGKGSIIFIDEIDAVGRLRFSGIGGGHDEREQTLNALLVEMDGFDGQQGLILIAATNRPDTLDPAILRPGRFDRTIIVNLPDIKGREEILKVHTRKIKLAPSVDLKSIASQTPGFSGADIANLCNEAALLGARKNQDAVQTIDFEKSVERVLMGPEKKTRIMSEKEKGITAFHEAGHALISLLLPEIDPLKKVSVIPRGLSGGYTFVAPIEDRHYLTKRELLARIALMLAGRASEEISLDDITTGAQDDLEKATHMARYMVCQLGMSDKLGNITLGKRQGLVFLGRDLMEEKNYSEETARLIDAEVKRIVDESYLKAKTLLIQHVDKLNILSKALLEKEVLDGEEVKRLIGIEAKEGEGKQ
ncbi:MAG: ATP-dependent zinc metalloprotease FtsH [Candidatus Omnitrophica bacterium]|nr:ATP-dependent zinc metalloprotease FtsH [Candidatus Omnitrophota bacterium]MBU4472577.1 ATP-dependent zinc metalloprotease FtsH [Candidatus Omnitrophota bacterium]MCG2705955.1 ATP-dependent zinc metalloprotease FtsH [Candidatus Omnitrophota bacterium]